MVEVQVRVVICIKHFIWPLKNHTPFLFSHQLLLWCKSSVCSALPGLLVAVGFGARESGTSGNDLGVKHFLLRCVCLLCWGSFLKKSNDCLLNIQQPYLASVFLLLNKKSNICTAGKSQSSLVFHVGPYYCQRLPKILVV